MASQIVGSQKFACVEVVDCLRLDNEMVFEDATFDGVSLDVLVSGAFSVVSTSEVTSTPSISFVAVEGVLAHSSAGAVNVLGGLDSATDSDGSVVLGHRLASNGSAVAVVKVDWVGGVNHLGFFGATPVVKHTTTGDVTGFVVGVGTASRDDSVYAGAAGATAYTVGDLVTALKSYGLLNA